MPSERSPSFFPALRQATLGSALALAAFLPQRALAQAENGGSASPAPSDTASQNHDTQASPPDDAAQQEPAPTTAAPEVATPGAPPADDGPPPITFPEGESPHGDVESDGPGSYDNPPYEGQGYDDSHLVQGPSKRIWDFTAGLSYAWLQDQLVLGPAVSLGQERFWLDLGTAPIFTLKNAPELNGNYLGQRFDLAFAYAPIDDMQWRVRLGVGVDLYALWGIDSEETKAALALKADVTYWASKNFGVELGLRGYPLSSAGLSVEKGPADREWLPFFFTTTLYFRSPGEHE